MGCNSSTEMPVNDNVSKLEAQDIQDDKNVDKLTEQIDRLMRVSIITEDASIPPDSSVDHIILDIISNWDWEDEYSSADECSSAEEYSIEC